MLSEFLRKNQLSRVSFHPRDPILLVGDDSGLITSHKVPFCLFYSSLIQAEQARAHTSIEAVASHTLDRVVCTSIFPDIPYEISKLDKILAHSAKLVALDSSADT